MKISRRDFFKLSATGAGLVSTTSLKAEEPGMALDCSQSYGVLVDTVVCIGCRRCEWACAEENKTSEKSLSVYEDKTVFDKHRRPDEQAYTVVNRFSNPQVPDKTYSMKVQCMHCNRPACVSACIVGALRKDEMGPVVYDAWKCIGCRYCMVACPFQIPAYEYANALDPRVMKCTFCFDRVVGRGERPACVAICPNEALTFGIRQDLIDAAYARIKNNPDRYVNHVYGEFEAGGTAWLYLAPVDFKHTELPQLSSEPIPDTTEKIQHGIFKSFVPPLALYGILGLIMHSMNNKKGEGEDSHE